MPEEKEIKLPTNLEFQRLLMAHRVLLARGDDPNIHVYELAKELYASKEELGLEFSDAFRVRVANEKALTEKIHDTSILDELRPRIETVHKAVVKRISEINTAFEQYPGLTLEKNELEKNIEFLASALQFSDLQKQILLFFSCASKGRFQSALKAAQRDTVVSQEDYVDGLATVLDLRDKKELLKSELEPDSTLLGVKFLAREEKSNEYIIDKPLQRILLKKYKSADDLLFSMLGPSPTTELKAEDYAYMERDLQDMLGTVGGYLDDKHSKRRKNLTIGGPPGTGKTEITAVLADKLKARAFLVGVANKSETTGFSLEEPSREDRINALVRSAFVIRKTGMRAMLVFDEAEDILRDLNSGDTKESGSKAFINELLEGLGAPVIFISNRTDLFDPATTRRILPYYSMSYMPSAARVGTILTKTKKYLSIDLTQDDVKPLSDLAANLSVAVIDSCLSVVGQRLTDKSDKQSILTEIGREFTRALRAQNGGLPPMPAKGTDELKGFDPQLISASDDVVSLHATFTKDAGRLAGKDFTIIGPAGTGRKSIARFLATATNMEPRVVPLDYLALSQAPTLAHALDMERSVLDATPLIFTDKEGFLLNSQGHPFLERVRAHPLPTFFVSDLPNSITQPELEQALSHLTFVVRTDHLSLQQTQSACKNILGVDVSTAELNEVKNLTIGAISGVKRQLEALGQEGNKEVALERMRAMADRLSKQSGPIGFAPLESYEQSAASRVARRSPANRGRE